MKTKKLYHMIHFFVFIDKKDFEDKKRLGADSQNGRLDSAEGLIRPPSKLPRVLEFVAMPPASAFFVVKPPSGPSFLKQNKPSAAVKTKITL